MKTATGIGVLMAGVLALPVLPSFALASLVEPSGPGSAELVARGGGGGGGGGRSGGGGGRSFSGGARGGGGGGARAQSGFRGSDGAAGFNRGSSPPRGGWSQGGRGSGSRPAPSLGDRRPVSGGGSLGDRTTLNRPSGDRNLGNRDLTNRNPGNRDLSNRNLNNRDLSNRDLNRNVNRDINRSVNRNVNRDVNRNWRQVNVNNINVNAGWARPGWGYARPWNYGWYGGWATPSWGWWGGQAALWGIGTLATAAVINSAVDNAISAQQTYIVVPSSNYQLLYGTVQPSGAQSVTFDVSVDGSTYQLSADCNAGLIDGQQPTTAEQAQLLNAACQVAFGATT